MVVIIKLFNIFAQQKQILKLFFPYSTSNDLARGKDLVHGLINDKTLTQPSSTLILVENGRLRLIVY